MSNLKLLIMAVLLADMCAAAQRFEARGLLLKVDSRERVLLISQETIPNYMEAMTMSYPVPGRIDLSALKPGSKIAFTLTVDSNNPVVSNIRVLVFSSVEREPLGAKSLALLDSTLQGVNRNHPQIHIGQRVPNFTLLDQTGNKVSLSDFFGKVVCITFIYTRCPLPEYCLRLSNNFGRLQKRFAAHMGKDLILLSITFDPAHDSPEVLARYSQNWKADPRSWRLLTGQPDEVKRICNLLGSNFWPEEGTLTHSLHNLVIDRSGQLAADVEGNEFSADQLGDLVASYL